MKKRVLLTLAIIVVISPLSSVYAEAIYNLTDLGGGMAFSINNDGQAVGVNDSYQATLFDTTGQGNHINLGSNGPATSINDNGQIVGWSYSTTFKAMMYKPSGGGYSAEEMGDGMAFSINNSGQAVGCYNPYIGPSEAAIFEYTTSPPGYDITTLGDGRAYSVNDSGQIVGYTNQYLPSNYAAIFDPVGNNTNLGTLSGYNSSEARSINESGQIVGYAYTYDPPADPYEYEGEDYRAVLFDETGMGNNIYLGTLDGYSDSQALSINDSGQIVGYCYNPMSQLWSYRAALFDPAGSGANIDLNDLIDPIPGWTLTEACSINNNGWIVGTMYDSSQNYHAYLLTPIPEPTTVLLLGLGGVMLRRIKHQGAIR